jgi:essential nuclear protein 1
LRQGLNSKADQQHDGQEINLADLILEKIAAHEAAQAGTLQTIDGEQEDDVELPLKVVEIYTQ